MLHPKLANRRDRKKAELQASIVHCALRLFRAQGFYATTMEQIASEADITKRTLYAYFPVKEAIVSFYWRSNVDENVDRFPQLLALYADTRARLNAVFLSAANAFKTDPEFARIEFGFQFQQLAKDPGHHLYGNKFGGFLAAVLAAGQERGDVRKDIPAAEMATQLVWSFTSACLLWFSVPHSFSLENRLEMLVTLFLDGAKG